MTAEEFKKIRMCNFKDFSNSTLDYYVNEANKILANGKNLDNEVIATIDKIFEEKEYRGN